MLGALVRFSVRRPAVVAGLALVCLLAGVRAVTRARLDVFPEFAPPQVSIQTEAPGFSPEQVELLVTRPIETSIVGVDGVALVRSHSIQGLSVITAVLQPGQEVRRARQALTERLVEVAGRLPASIPPPVLAPLTSSSSTVLVIGLTSATRSTLDLRTWADWVLRPRLLSTPGVAKVAIFGGDERQFEIRVDPAALRRHGIGLDAVTRAAASATGVRGAGVWDGANQRITITAEGQARSAQALGSALLRGGAGTTLRLHDVATVVEGAAPRIGEGAVNGKRGLVIVVSGQLGANTKEVATAVEGTLDGLRPAIAAQGFVLTPDLFRPAAFVDLALRNITIALLLGAALVAVILFLFLADLGTAAISLTAIPLSLLSAILVLDWLGYSINTLTLGGLAIALGEVVDDAIIDVENIARRLRENRLLPEPQPTSRVVYDASLEVRSSVVYATFIVALVLLPVVALTGVHGALFRPLALSYILATLASLVVALSVTPALTLLLLGRRRARDRHPTVLLGLRAAYGRALDAALARPRLVLTGAALACAGALALVPRFGAAFLPRFQEGHYLVHMSAVPGTSLDESLRIGQRVAAALRTDPRIRHVAARIGRAELSEDTWGAHYTEFEVDLVPLTGDDARRIEDDIRALLAQFPGVSFAVRSFLSERIEETLTGSTAEVVVHVSGEELDTLDAAARNVAAIARAVPGARDVQYEPPPVAPEFLVQLDGERVARAGLRPDEVLAAVEIATRGLRVAQVLEGPRTTDVVVRLAQPVRGAPELLADLPLASEDGRLVTLGEVATLGRRSGRYLIAHRAAQRVQTVTANVAGGDVEAFTRQLEAEVARPGVLPRGVYAEVGGTGVAGRGARRELLLNSALAAAGILLLLAAAFGDASRVALVLANVPLALVGGVVAVALTGGVLSLGSLVGFVTLFGIATRNAVMLVSHYDHLVQVEGAPWGEATLRRGALERVGPILMTALVTGLGLLPLALGSGDPGREIEGPLAAVILGGLASSTLLSLFVLPVLARSLGRFADGASPAPEGQP